MSTRNNDKYSKPFSGCHLNDLIIYGTPKTARSKLKWIIRTNNKAAVEVHV